MVLTVKVEGLKELERNLDKVSRATGKNAVRRALIKGGEKVARPARIAAPKREYDLSESIDVLTKAVPSEVKQSPVEVYVGPGRMPQAITQEFGTWFHPARPYMRPAWDANKMDVLDEVGFSLFEEIDKAIDRAARKAAK